MMERAIKTLSAFAFLTALVLLSADGTIASDIPTLRYRFDRISGESVKYRITLTFKGEADGSTNIELPNEWGGQLELYNAIKDLRAVSQRSTLADTAEPHIKSVTHQPGAEVVVQYFLEQDFTGPLRNAIRYRPIVADDHIHWIGDTVLIRPQLAAETIVDAEFDWRGFPRVWAFANSYGTKAAVQKRRLPLEDLGRSITVAGDFRITRVLAGKRPVHLAIRGEWKFKDEELAQMAARVIETQRDFWDDHSQKFYLITLVPLDEGPNSYSYGGTGLLDSFALFATPDADVAGLRGLLAHEYFHNWNPVQLGKMPDPERSMYWLSEGFTDFFTYELLHRSKLISTAEYIAEINRRISDYFMLPVRTAPNARNVDDFWTDRDVGRLPYLRGSIFAMNLNAAIERETGGRRSLDDVMRALYLDAKNGKPAIDRERIINSAAKFLPEGRRSFAGLLEEQIYRGALIVPADDALGPEARLETAKLPVWEPGFDTDALIKEKTINGVRPGTAAFNAGLRNGQKLIGGFSIYFGNTSREIELKVSDESGEKDIRFLPVALEKLDVPQFVAAERSSGNL